MNLEEIWWEDVPGLILLRIVTCCYENDDDTFGYLTRQGIFRLGSFSRMTLLLMASLVSRINSYPNIRWP
jgi:hypothetical protein